MLGILICGICYAQEQYIAESFGLYSKGIEYYHAGKLHEAREILEKAVGLDPRNEDAQGYLDLVNAELRMRAKGMLDVYQSEAELRRESDFEDAGVYAEIEEDYYEPEDMEIEEEYYEEYYEYEPEGPRYSEDKIKAITDALNEKIAPSEIRGEYKMAIGVRSDDVIWKEANGDYNERNFRMINHNFPKTNTYDTRVYDKFKVVFDTNKDGEGLNFHSDITVDPWSFVGKTGKFTVNGSGGDRVEMELKYWSGMRSTINETFYTLDNRDSIGTSEYKVTDGNIPPFSISSNNGNSFTIPEQDIDFAFQPIRELWFDYKIDSLNFRLFPFGLGDQALSSDDPLGLSNRHIYWEASPWLDDWVPGHVNTTPSPDEFWRGEWSNDLSHFTRDSELSRLTALRGVSLEGDLTDNTSLMLTLASPKGLWQEYDSITTFPGALRAKTWINDGLMLGFTDTFRIGYNEGEVDSYNYVTGVDVSCEINPTTNMVAEFAYSESKNDKTSTYDIKKDGTTVHIDFKKETGFGNARLAFTHMSEDFDPGLANYKETRKDQSWGRHIHFKKPYEYRGTSLNYADIEPFRIGDGIDVDRNVLNFRLESEDVFEERMDNLIDYRYVRDSNHKYVEGVLREENTFRIAPSWTSKILMIYHDLPKTKANKDPIQYDADTGEYLENTSIKDGEDPSVSTYSVGLEFAPAEWFTIFGIYENTNDFRFSTGNHPSGLLNSVYFTNEAIEGKNYSKEVIQLYSQGFFDLPPYGRFHIYRAGVSLKPTKKLGIDFDYTKNDFKFAAGIDDNINHFGTTLKYTFSNRLTGFLKYTFSKAYNLYRLNTSGDLRYEEHHNIFAELNYNVTEYGFLVIQFGEGNVVSPVWGATATPFGDSYPTLDTQHILRIYYSGRF